MTSGLTNIVFVVVAVILAGVLCGLPVNSQQTQSNPWNIPNNSQVTSNTPKFGQKSTTPWPALGQRPIQRNSALSNNKKEPMWIRPNNGTIWIRNNPQVNQNENSAATYSHQITPSTFSSTPKTNTVVSMQRQNVASNQNVRIPQRNQADKNKGIANNYNVQFINNERGVDSSTQASREFNQKTPLVDSTKLNNGQTRYNSMSNIHQGFYSNSTVNNKGVSSTLTTGLKDELETDTQDGDVMINQDNSVQDYELREFSEELLSKDINNPNRHVVVNLQGITTSRSTKDEAPLPLLNVDQAAYAVPTVAKVMLLFNNYILETNQNEVYTPQERLEENDLLDAILPTPVMQHTRNFLIKKGKIGKDPKEFKDMLRQIWFNMYSRGGGRIGSSGFEHVFLAELKGNQVSGLHNWLYFSDEEKRNNANYLGYMKKVDLGNKGSILKYHFVFHNVDKPVGSMFIGTSPELEMSLYTTCFVLRADRVCPLKMNGNRFVIRTFTYRYRGKNMIGSAFPEI